MAGRARPVLEVVPGQERFVGSAQRALDTAHANLENLDASQVAYTPSNAGDWVSPAPTTVQQALDRLGAAGGTVPVP